MRRQNSERAISGGKYLLLSTLPEIRKPPDVTDTGGFVVDSISRIMELNEYATVYR